jgi:glycosyltransferase involved in cell wall biosynthesis
MINRLHEMQVETHVIHTTRPFDITKWKTVKQFIKKQQVDLIHAHGTRANSNILWAAKSLHIPVVYTIHGWSFHPDQKAFVRRLRIMGEHYLTSKSTVNISVSKSNQQSGKNYINSFRSIVINNGIDQKKFNPDQQYHSIRDELAIPADSILILFVARFTSHKQPLTLIHAFKKAAEANPSLHLLMVGDGDQKEEAIELISKLKLQNKITLQSFRQDVPSILAASDIFVLPSLWEGLPIGLLEAMSMGKAVIASNVDGTSEIIEHNRNGWLVETNDLVTNTAEALIHLSKDEEMRRRFSEKARATITQRFNAATMTGEIEQLYNKVLLKQLSH